MKTNQNLVRKLGSFEVIQRTKDGYFNATSLIKMWNDNSNIQKRMQKFFDNFNTEQFIIELKEDLNSTNSGYLRTRGKQGGTWMHPYLFVKFAMWLNPKFELQVIKFVYDNLIRFRIEGADSYKKMNDALCNWMQRNYNKKPDQMDYVRLANLIKSKVGVSDWNKASEKQSIRRKDIEQVYEYAFNNNLSKKETQRMIKFQLTKPIN